MAEVTVGRVSRRARVLLTSLALLVLALAAWVLWPSDAPERSVSTSGGSGARVATAAEPPTPADATPATGAGDTPGSPAGVRDVVRLVVRDLWSRDPLPALDLRVVPPDGDEQELRTDPRGEIEVDAAVLDDATTWECASGPQRIASSALQIRRDREIWCCRTGTVLGRVVFENVDTGTKEPALDEVRIEFSPEYMGRDASSLSEPGHWGWMRRSALRPRGRDTLVRPDRSGAFRIEVQALHGSAVVARASGFCPAWQLLDDAALRGEREVVLVLRPGLPIAGRLTDDAGAALVGVRVHVYVVIETSYDDAELTSVGRNRSGGFTVARSLKDDWTRYTLHYAATTDAEGAWGVDLDADGELIVVAHPEGHAAVDIQAGQVSRLVSGAGLELVARRDAGTAICLYRNGRPLSSTAVEFCDLSLHGAQPNFRLETDASGTLQSPWLLRGKRYSIRTKDGSRSVYWQFTGQTRIDLDSCETNFDRFFGRTE